MRVLTIITNTFKISSGISSVVMNYYANLNHKNVEMDFIVINDIDDDMRNIFIKNNSKVFVVKNRNKSPIKYVSRLRKIIKDNKYDIIHAHGNSATLAVEMLAAKLGGCKIRIAHSHNTRTKHPVIDKALRPLFCCLCNARFACGKDAGEWLFGKRKFTIIHNGCDTEGFCFDGKKRSKIRNKYKLGDYFVVGHVGNFNIQKNQKFTVEIIKQMSSDERYKFVFIGDGALRDATQRAIDELGLRNKVLFLGSVQNMNEWYQALDVIILPSLYEGVPMTLIEGQISGLDCICSNYVTGEADFTGRVQYIPVSDDKAVLWADKIKAISNENRKGYDRAKKSRLSVTQAEKNNFSIKMNSKQLEEEYEALCASYEHQVC